MKTIQANDLDAWVRIKAFLKIDGRESVEAIVVVPPWIDGKGATIMGLNLKEDDEDE